jgi:hypothetical protein
MLQLQSIDTLFTPHSILQMEVFCREPCEGAGKYSDASGQANTLFFSIEWMYVCAYARSFNAVRMKRSALPLVCGRTGGRNAPESGSCFIMSGFSRRAEIAAAFFWKKNLFCGILPLNAEHSTSETPGGRMPQGEAAARRLRAGAGVLRRIPDIFQKQGRRRPRRREEGMRFPWMLLFVFTCGFLLAACGGRDIPPDDGDMAQCPGIFIFGPSRYAISLAVGKEIMLDPAFFTIPVYCTAEQAHRAAKDAQRSGSTPAMMDLRVYRLEGEWRALTREGDEGGHFLSGPAALIEPVN